MALADYNLRYELPFKDVDGNQWRVRIYDRDEAGSVERLWGTGNPVSIYYEGDEDLSSGIIGSSCTIRVYGRPDTAGTSDLSQFFVSDEERFYVKVEYAPDGSTYSTYWTGFLFQDEYTEYITSDPYEVELVALDRLGTIKKGLNTLGYGADDNPTLKDIVQSFIDETKLELTLSEGTGILTENGAVSSFLTDQRISTESFLLENSFVEMENISDVVSSIALSLNCRVWQQGGQLSFKTLSRGFIEFPTFSVPNDYVISVDDNLSVRHRSSKKFTNISINVGSRNLLTNGSFETDALNDTTPTGWTKPAANTLATIEVSDEAIAEGSNQSLKTVNNRISDSTFDAASTANKNGQYCLLETSSEDTKMFRNILSSDAFLGSVGFSFFINNANNIEPYEIRFSMSRKDADGVDLYYDWELKKWATEFKYSFFDASSDGEWIDLDLEFYLLSNWFVDNDETSIEPIVFRIHTMNYSDAGGLSDVQVFYDNFYLRLYNGGVINDAALLPDTNFFNLSSDQNTDTKSGSTDLELLCGLTSAEVIFLTVVYTGIGKLNGKIKGQYINDSTGFAENVGFKDALTRTYQPLPSELMRLRVKLDEDSRKVYSGTFATKRVDDNSWIPIFFGDKFTISYTGYTDYGLNGFTRFGVELKENRYSIDAINLP